MACMTTTLKRETIFINQVSICGWTTAFPCRRQLGRRPYTEHDDVARHFQMDILSSPTVRVEWLFRVVRGLQYWTTFRRDPVDDQGVPVALFVTMLYNC